MGSVFSHELCCRVVVFVHMPDEFDITVPVAGIRCNTVLGDLAGSSSHVSRSQDHGAPVPEGVRSRGPFHEDIFMVRRVGDR